MIPKITPVFVLVFWTVIVHAQTKMFNREERRAKVHEINRELFCVDHKKISSLFDTAIIINSKSSVYEIFVKDDILTIIQKLSLAKQISPEKVKRIRFCDTVYNNKLGSNPVIENRILSFLDMPSNATANVDEINSLDQSSYQYNASDYYFFVFIQGQSSYIEITDWDSELISLNKIKVKNIFDEIRNRFQHFDNLSNLVKKNGSGRYYYSEYDKSMYFDYTREKVYKFLGKYSAPLIPRF
jgi:hypothetical protein